MSTRYTDGFILLWDLASLEAQAGTHDCIRPEHLFIALCKMGDIPIGGLRDDGSPAVQEKIPDIERELSDIRRTFEVAVFDRKIARRHVRVGLGEPGLPVPPDGIWHRTDDAKWCCDRAVRLARAEGQKKATPLHLLKAFLDPEASFPILEQVITDALRKNLASN